MTIRSLFPIEYAVPDTDGKRKNVKQTKSRILLPSEYNALRKVMNDEERIFFDGLLLTGMRIVEYKLFLMHPEWYDSGFIHLPTISIKKKKATVKQRYVHLSSKGRTTIEYIHKVLKDSKVIRVTNQALTTKLKEKAKEADVSTEGLNLKCFRKTYESWLVMSYSSKTYEILMSQGHTSLTSIKHYLNLGFTPEDVSQMHEWVDNWQ